MAWKEAVRVGSTKARSITKSERDTNTRLWELVKQGVIFSFNVPKPDKWEIFDTEDDYVAAGGLARREEDRKYLTKAEVRARFKMDPPKPAKVK